MLDDIFSFIADCFGFWLMFTAFIIQAIAFAAVGLIFFAAMALVVYGFFNLF